MINRADGATKSRIGRLAYIWAGAQGLTARRVRAKIKIDGKPWFKGDVACVLVGNVPKVFGNVTVFDDARPDDGCLDVGVATASNAYQLSRSLARVATGRSDQAPHVHLTPARKLSIRTSRPVRYEMDGGARGRTRRIKLRVVPSALTICVPGR
jgi:diacylglycerol kinase (ATP)